ncbi:hypothetical protein EVAR_100937_1 [Eumeta japonica]|uniref:Uncharacterized protein n=1 Tax=Eumeta variegata TaxID=151549 RepID=A0A4C1SYS3_EUMVA|nr:hypothetical protein EVAR_100937_1 [Eumeta japonica]
MFCDKVVADTLETLLGENSALTEAITSFDFQITQNYRVTNQVRILMEEHHDTLNPFNDILSYSNQDDDCSEDGNDDTLDDECDETASSQCGKTRYNMAENIDVPKALGDIVGALSCRLFRLS